MKGELKNKFDEYKSDTSDIRFDWEMMGPQINKGMENRKKKKRRGFFWFYLGTGVIGLLVIGFYIFNTKNIKSVDRNTVAHNRDAFEDVTLTLDDRTTPNLISNLDEEKNSKIINSTTENNLQQLNNNTYRQKVNDEYKDFQRPSGNLNYFNYSDNDQSLTSTIGIQNGEFYKGDYATSQESNLTFRETINSTDKNRTLKIPFLYSSVETRFNSVSIHPILSNKLDLLGENVELPKVENKNQLDLAISPWFIDFNMGANTSNVSESFTNSTNRIGRQFSTHIEYQTNSGFIFGSGIQYQNIQFQTTAQFIDSIELYRPNTIDTIYQYGDGEEYFVFTDSISGLGVTNFGHTNQLTTYSLPVFAGYNWNIKRISFGVRLGMNLQIIRRFQGVIVSDANDRFEIDEVKTKLDLGYYLRGQIGYHISNRFSIWGHVVQNRVSLSGDHSELQRGSASVISGTIGLRMRLNQK